MARALEVLFSLGALDAGCRLTKPVGQGVWVMRRDSTADGRGARGGTLENAKRKFAVLEGDQLPVVSCRGNTLNLRKAIVSGFFAQAGKLQADGTYTTLKGSASMSIHPSSVLFRAAPPWVVYHDLLYTTKHFMRDVTPIEPEWLPEMAPQFYEYEQRTLVRNDAYINAPDRPLPKSGTAGVLKGPARPAGY
eukprot:tig00000473_g1200.t1